MTARLTTSRSGNGGFTLIEMLMAMLILTVGLLGLLQSIQVAYRHNSGNRMREQAVLIAEEQMKNFKANPFEQITATYVTAPATSDIGLGTRNFTVLRDCEGIGSSSADNKCGPSDKSKILTVGVSWTFRNVTTKHIIYAVKNRD